VRCKGCDRVCLVVDLSASGLCGNCLSAGFSASWSRVVEARTWGASDCPACAVSSRSKGVGTGHD